MSNLGGKNSDTDATGGLGSPICEPYHRIQGREKGQLNRQKGLSDTSYAIYDLLDSGLILLPCATCYSPSSEPAFAALACEMIFSAICEGTIS